MEDSVTRDSARLSVPVSHGRPHGPNPSLIVSVTGLDSGKSRTIGSNSFRGQLPRLQIDTDPIGGDKTEAALTSLGQDTIMSPIFRTFAGAAMERAYQNQTLQRNFVFFFSFPAVAMFVITSTTYISILLSPTYCDPAARWECHSIAISGVATSFLVTLYFTFGYRFATKMHMNGSNWPIIFLAFSLCMFVSQDFLHLPQQNFPSYGSAVFALLPSGVGVAIDWRELLILLSASLLPILIRIIIMVTRQVPFATIWVYVAIPIILSLFMTHVLMHKTAMSRKHFTAHKVAELRLEELTRKREAADNLLKMALPHPIIAELRLVDGNFRRLTRNVMCAGCLYVDIKNNDWISKVRLESNGNGAGNGYIHTSSTSTSTNSSSSSVINEENIIAILNHQFWTLDQIISSFPAVEKIKTTAPGKALLLEGLFSPHYDTMPSENTDQLFTIGMQIIHEINQLKIASAELEGYTPPRINIGLSRGRIVAGIMGLSRFCFDIVGDTVNMSQRMSSLAENGQIIMTNVAYTALTSVQQSYCKALGIRSVKGKGDMEIYCATYSNRESHHADPSGFSMSSSNKLASEMPFKAATTFHSQLTQHLQANMNVSMDSNICAGVTVSTALGVNSASGAVKRRHLVSMMTLRGTKMLNQNLDDIMRGVVSRNFDGRRDSRGFFNESAPSSPATLMPRPMPLVVSHQPMKVHPSLFKNESLSSSAPMDVENNTARSSATQHQIADQLLRQQVNSQNEKQEYLAQQILRTSVLQKPEGLKDDLAYQKMHYLKDLSEKATRLLKFSDVVTLVLQHEISMWSLRFHSPILSLAYVQEVTVSEDSYLDFLRVLLFTLGTAVLALLAGVFGAPPGYSWSSWINLSFDAFFLSLILIAIGLAVLMRSFMKRNVSAQSSPHLGHFILRHVMYVGAQFGIVGAISQLVLLCGFDAFPLFSSMAGAVHLLSNYLLSESIDWPFECVFFFASFATIEYMLVAWKVFYLDYVAYWPSFALCALCLTYVNVRANRVSFLLRQISEVQEMLAGIEHMRSDLIVKSILPSRVIQSLQQHPSSLYVESYTATVLIMDICNFTSLSSQVSAIEIIEMLNELFSMIDLRLAELDGLEKMHTQGDAYIATTQPTKSRVVNSTYSGRLLRLAMDIQEVILPRLNRSECARPFSTAITARIGIHSGHVRGAVMSGLTKVQYDLFGNTKDVAFDLEALSAPGDVYVTSVTKDLVQHQRKQQQSADGVIQQPDAGEEFIFEELPHLRIQSEDHDGQQLECFNVKRRPNRKPSLGREESPVSPDKKFFMSP